MFLNNIFRTTLEKEKAAIILYLINSIFIMLFYYLLYGKELIIYPIILTLSFLGIYFIYKFFVYKKLYKVLEDGMSSPKYKVQDGYIYKDILDCLKQIHRMYISKIYKIESSQAEKNNLISQWIHNMKTSVSVIELAAEEGINKVDKNQEIFQDILEEKYKLQDNLEGALNMFRIEEFSKDYVPEKVSLKELVSLSVNSKKRDFIYSKVYPKLSINDEFIIYTDKKWGRYVIEQILSNSIKYSDKPNSDITINATKVDGNVILNIIDQGIGIREEDKSRIFNLFFTGNNGRENKSSTGIGLYMCKLICEKLNNNIEIESSEGKGTKVSIKYLIVKE